LAVRKDSADKSLIGSLSEKAEENVSRGNQPSDFTYRSGRSIYKKISGQTYGKLRMKCDFGKS